MSMLAFLEHVENCRRCHNTPKNLCSVGYDLWSRGSERLVRLYDPKRAKA